MGGAASSGADVFVWQVGRGGPTLRDWVAGLDFCSGSSGIPQRLRPISQEKLSCSAKPPRHPGRANAVPTHGTYVPGQRARPVRARPQGLSTPGLHPGLSSSASTRLGGCKVDGSRRCKVRGYLNARLEFASARYRCLNADLGFAQVRTKS